MALNDFNSINFDILENFAVILPNNLSYDAMNALSGHSNCRTVALHATLFSNVGFFPRSAMLSCIVIASFIRLTSNGT